MNEKKSSYLSLGIYVGVKDYFLKDKHLFFTLRRNFEYRSLDGFMTRYSALVKTCRIICSEAVEEYEQVEQDN